MAANFSERTHKKRENEEQRRRYIYKEHKKTYRVLTAFGKAVLIAPEGKGLGNVSSGPGEFHRQLFHCSALGCSDFDFFSHFEV